MDKAIALLLERLQSGWAPIAYEIDPLIPQHTMLDWDWWPHFNNPGMLIAGSDLEDRLEANDVLWVDQHLGWALATSGFYWLYDDEESKKVRYLGG